MDLGSSPKRILKTHSSDKVAHLFSDPRSATERTRLPSPVSGEAHSVPTHDSFGPDDGYGIKNTRKATIEPNEQGAVGPAQIQSTWCALSKHVQLMTQNQKFSVKPASRLEAIAHHADEKEGDCDHQRGSCSDSGTAATPADGVFGSDRVTFETGSESDFPKWCRHGKSLARGEFAIKDIDVPLVDFPFEIVQFGIAFVFVNVDIPIQHNSKRRWEASAARRRNWEAFGKRGIEAQLRRRRPRPQGQRRPCLAQSRE